MVRRRDKRPGAAPELDSAAARAAPPLLECADPIDAGELDAGTWFVVLRADRIPHLALLEDGACWSLEHDGLHRYSPARLWRLIQSRHVPTVLCRLDVDPASRALPFFERHVARGLDGDVDCFVPLRDYVASWFPAGAACEYAFELLPLLARAGKIAKAASLHLPGVAPGKPFAMPRYDRNDIRERIAHVRKTRGTPE